MRWIDRGPEPAGVAGYARQFTQGWVDHYRQTRGQPPTDSYWREFRPLLGDRSNNICWYCERQCDVMAESGGLSPTVDHFRPRQKCPQLVYEWSNWMFSCQRCNDRKGNRWPESGYVDPSVEDVSERPIQYFDYDARTGEIIPRGGLSQQAERKVWDTIDDLGLNHFDLRLSRFQSVLPFVESLLERAQLERQSFSSEFLEKPVEHIGVIAMIVEQFRQDGRI